MIELSKSAQTVQAALQAKGLDFKVVELPSSTRTASEAAQTIGCDAAQIIKSLLFKTKHTQQPILILASGINQVDLTVLTKVLNEEIVKADADFARQVTGFAIGGIPPIGHREKMKTFIDEDLLTHTELWAAAGTPHAVFKLHANDLQRLVDGEVINITQYHD